MARLGGSGAFRRCRSANTPIRAGRLSFRQRDRGENNIERKTLGLAVIGSGRIGGLRAQLAAGHPAVRFIATADQDPKKAEALAKKVGASVHSDDNDAIIAHPDVNAVIVSTSEGEHLAPILKALSLGKPVLVEKPIALSVADADQVIRTIEKSGVGVHVGYSRRYKERYLIAKEQLVQGRLGTLTGGAARVFNSRSQALAMLSRNAHATPVVDALTYYVDLMNWFHEGNIRVHGIRPSDVDGAPTMPEALDFMLRFIDSDVLIAHNAPFDMGVLRASAAAIEAPLPDLNYACSLAISRKTYNLESYRLNSVAYAIGHEEFKHHDALADADACARMERGCRAGDRH